MAAHDILLWSEQATRSLPNGQVNITFDGTINPPEYNIEVAWVEAGDPLDYTIKIPVRPL
jgi:hypothetical protein